MADEILLVPWWIWLHKHHAWLPWLVTNQLQAIAEKQFFYIAYRFSIDGQCQSDGGGHIISHGKAQHASAGGWTRHRA